jgi:hypothetical protein
LIPEVRAIPDPDPCAAAGCAMQAVPRDVPEQLLFAPLAAGSSRGSVRAGCATRTVAPSERQ